MFPMAYFVVGGALIAWYLYQQMQPAGAPALPSGPIVPEPPGDVLGYNPDVAVRLAPELAAEIMEKGARANKELVRAFQSAAGVTVDGAYGPDTREALRFWLGIAGSPLAEPPDALTSKSKAPQPYVPPGGVPGKSDASSPIAVAQSALARYPGVVGFNPQVAQALAPVVANTVASYKRGYFDNPVFAALVALFQKAAGLTADGKYGPKSRGALIFYLNRAGMPGGDAPPSYFGVGTTPYRPPS